MKEFWNDIAVDRSWKVLITFKKEFDFILIGGWACYLLTKNIKSKDIDIIVDFSELDKIRKKYWVKKNPNLKKYETVVEEISVDIYVSHYSKFPVPFSEIMKNYLVLEGLKVLRPELLLILKQNAEMERMHSIKGQKDRIDILNILINSRMDMKYYLKIVKKYKLYSYPDRLKKIIKNSNKEFLYFGVENPREIKLMKRRLLESLKFL